MPDDTALPAYETVQVESPLPQVWRITLNRPERRNAFNTQMAEELIALWAEVAAAASNDHVRCAVLTGSGTRAFCAGADLKERHGMSEADWRHQHALFEEMAQALRDCPVPVIAAVEGAAFAGGFELMLSCTFAYAGESARFALTEVTLGLIPGIGGTQLLPRAVGRARAMEILTVGRPFSAAEALEWGVVNRLCPDGTAAASALETAAAIASNAPLSVRRAVQSVRGGMDRPLPEALTVELDCYRTLIDTDDRREGIAAFNEKRKPVFKGR
jgi:enoyl-CoA hydratase/carnithine racemase